MAPKPLDPDTLQSILAVLVDATVRPSGTMPHDELKYHCVAEVPVLLLLKKLRPPQPTVDFVALRYLDIFTKSNKGRGFLKLLINSDALSAACRVVELGASRATTEKVILTAAEYGWLRVEKMILKLLGRNPNAKEIFGIVNAYVSDLGRRATHNEQEMLRMAYEYLTTQEANEVAELLKEFGRKWDNAVDY